MSSSDDELEQKQQAPSRQLVPVKEEKEQAKPIDQRFDPNTPSNQEIILNFIEFEKGYDFESLFLLGNMSQYGGKVFNDQYK